MSAMPICNIRVGDRIRGDLGDIDGLARNIDAIGLLKPLAVLSDGTLLAGARRLAAVKLLGWQEVPVPRMTMTIFLSQLPYELQVEISENQFHKDLTPSEMDEARRRIEPFFAAAAKTRQRREGRTNGGGKFPPAIKRKTRDLVGGLLGISSRSLDKIRAVTDAAKADPGRFGDLVKDMDRTGNVDRTYRKMLIRRDEGCVASLQPVAGTFPTLVVDPPWNYQQWRGRRAGPPYATMSSARVACVAHPELGREQMSLVSVDHERLHAASKRTCRGLGARAQDDYNLGQTAYRVRTAFSEPHRARGVRDQRRPCGSMP